MGAYEVVHETVTWLGAGGGGLALLKLVSEKMLAARAKSAAKDGDTPTVPVFATSSAMGEMARRVAALELIIQQGGLGDRADALEQAIEGLQQRLADERRKRYELQKSMQDFLQKQEDAWRRLERTLGQIEGQLKTRG